MMSSGSDKCSQPSVGKDNSRMMTAGGDNVDMVAVGIQYTNAASAGVRSHVSQDGVQLHGGQGSQWLKGAWPGFQRDDPSFERDHKKTSDLTESHVIEGGMLSRNGHESQWEKRNAHGDQKCDFTSRDTSGTEKSCLNSRHAESASCDRDREWFGLNGRQREFPASDAEERSTMASRQSDLPTKNSQSTGAVCSRQQNSSLRYSDVKCVTSHWSQFDNNVRDVTSTWSPSVTSSASSYTLTTLLSAPMIPVTSVSPIVTSCSPPSSSHSSNQTVNLDAFASASGTTTTTASAPTTPRSSDSSDVTVNEDSFPKTPVMATATRTTTTVATPSSSPSPQRGQGRRVSGVRGAGGSTRLTADNNTLPPCRVCGSAASGFHYGVNTCEACKRFFRRSLDRKRTFRCRGDNNCSIGNIVLCAYCRHKRCLAVGMSKTAIKTGRYSHEKRSENIQEVRKREMGLVSSVMIQEEEVQGIVGALVAAYGHVVSNLDVPLAEMQARGRQKLEDFRLKADMFGQQYTLSDEQYQDIYSSTGIDVDGRRQHGRFVAKSVEIFVYNFVKFSKGVLGFAKLPLPDQAALLKEGWLDVWFFAAHRGFLEDLQIFYAPNKDVQTSSELVRSFGPKFVEGSYVLARRLQHLSLTREEVIVLSAVSLLSSDRCALQSPQSAEDVHWTLIACLLHLLRHSHGACAMMNFARIATTLTELRTVTHEGKKSLMSTHFSDIIQNYPILVDILH